MNRTGSLVPATAGLLMTLATALPGAESSEDTTASPTLYERIEPGRPRWVAIDEYTYRRAKKPTP